MMFIVDLCDGGDDDDDDDDRRPKREKFHPQTFLV
jgi:hypothetical protein